MTERQNLRIRALSGGGNTPPDQNVFNGVPTDGVECFLEVNEGEVEAVVLASAGRVDESVDSGDMLSSIASRTVGCLVGEKEGVNGIAKAAHDDAEQEFCGDRLEGDTSEVGGVVCVTFLVEGNEDCVVELVGGALSCQSFGEDES